MPFNSGRWWTVFAMSGAFAMFVIDTTGVSVSLPRIQQKLAPRPGQPAVGCHGFHAHPGRDRGNRRPTW